MSENMPLLEIINKYETIIEYGTKDRVHREGLLHRAFSVFLYDTTRKVVLIQKRAFSKYHSGGLWSNSCCSHKYKNETWEESIARCLKDELSIEEKSIKRFTKHLGTFYYFSDYGNIKEHENDRVILYTPEVQIITQIVPNQNEVMELRWMCIDDIDKALRENPSEFTSWFPKAYTYFRKAIKKSELQN